ncbi:hypothetical protein [Streptomyces cadmiisoli]|uniref:hypothetical protein n=1 Tax=Streptomyces cadmiisoli TaxID=2184053 RepID=UPI0013A6D151|nr:hypothetical protein [Streptomyces cadmiisoli]
MRYTGVLGQKMAELQANPDAGFDGAALMRQNIAEMVNPAEIRQSYIAGCEEYKEFLQGVIRKFSGRNEYLTDSAMGLIEATDANIEYAKRPDFEVEIMRLAYKELS